MNLFSLITPEASNTKAPGSTDSGFTIAELLITLGILAVIAVFTIPKVLTSSGGTQYNSVGQELVGMVVSAYTNEQLINGITASTGIANLTQHMNYTEVDTTSLVDSLVGFNSRDCSNTGSFHCLQFHNGASLLYYEGESFGGTAATNMVRFEIDPDGMYSGLTDPSATKAHRFYLYFDGGVKDEQSVKANSASSTAGPVSASLLRPNWWTAW